MDTSDSEYLTWNSSSLEIFICSHSNCDDEIMTNFSTWDNSTTVVTCAKFVVIRQLGIKLQKIYLHYWHNFLCYCFINGMIKNYAPFKNCTVLYMLSDICDHDDVIKWKHFPCYWPFVWEIHWSPVNSTPHPPGQWRGALMFSLICIWINGWVNSGEAGDLRCYRTHYDVTVMIWFFISPSLNSVDWNQCSKLRPVPWSKTGKFWGGLTIFLEFPYYFMFMPVLTCCRTSNFFC